MHSIDACERETCASQGSANPLAGERPTVSVARQRDQVLHAVAVAQLDERRVRRAPRRAAPAARSGWTRDDRASRARPVTLRPRRKRAQPVHVESRGYERHRSPRTLARIRRSRRSRARRAAGQEVRAGEGAERPGLRARAGRGGRELRARARAAARRRPPPSRSRRPRAASTTTQDRGRRASSDRDARRSKETGNDYGVAEAYLGDAPLPGRPSTCASPGTRSPTRARPRRASAGRSRTPCCAGSSSRSGRLAPDEPLSARYVWMSAKETDQREEYPSTFLEEDGTSLKAGLDVVRKFGVPLESELPWEGGLATARPRRSTAPRGGAGSWPTSTSATTACDRAERFDEWRRWLHQNGPVLVLIAQDRTSALHRRARRRSTPTR